MSGAPSPWAPRRLAVPRAVVAPAILLFLLLSSRRGGDVPMAAAGAAVVAATAGRVAAVSDGTSLSSPSSPVTAATTATTTGDDDDGRRRRYPQDALRCYATLAPPRGAATQPISSKTTGRIICPEGRDAYCVKEVSNTSRRDCGTTFEYPYDTWDVELGQCVYRKCSKSCRGVYSDGGRRNNEGGSGGVDEQENVTWFGPRGDVFERATYCCDSGLCNSVGRGTAPSRWVVALMMACPVAMVIGSLC